MIPQILLLVGAISSMYALRVGKATDKPLARCFFKKGILLHNVSRVCDVLAAN
jgi:hypothetical protein